MVRCHLAECQQGEEFPGRQVVWSDDSLWLGLAPQGRGCPQQKQWGREAGPWL